MIRQIPSPAPPRPARNWRHLALTAGALLLAGGCAALRPGAPSVQPAFYLLDTARPAGAVLPRAAASGAPTLLISAPHAAAGYDSQRIVYRQQAHRLDSFAHSEWLDTPAHMLVPLLVAALEQSGSFHAVLHTPSSATGDLRLDSEILQLQQDFTHQPAGQSGNGQARTGASRVHFVLRVQLIEEASRRVIAARDFSADSPAPSDDPYGGVIAANQAVQKVLDELVVFCAEAAAGWHPLK